MSTISFQGQIHRNECMVFTDTARILVIQTKLMTIKIKLCLKTQVNFDISNGSLICCRVEGQKIFSGHDNLDKLKQFLGGRTTFSRLTDFYTALRELDSGSFSRVVQLECKLSMEKYAAKCISKRALTMKEIHQEIKIMRALKHPNIVSLLEVYESENTVYLIMEELDRILTPDYDHEEIKLILHQLLQSVEHIHKQGFIHRDLKFKNIMFDKSNSLKIIDFGLSCPIVSKSSFAKCGTPGYLAPELFRERQSGQICDLFSVGAIMYEMYTKKPLFEPRTAEKMLKENQNFRLQTAILPVIPDHGTNLLNRLLEEPRQRISAKEALLHPYFEAIRLDFENKQSIKSLQPKFKDQIVNTNESRTKPTTSYTQLSINGNMLTQQKGSRNFSHH